MKKGEVWSVEFPLEEDPDRILNRPVIVLDENLLGVLSVKITKHKAKIEDPYDIPIIYWDEAGSRLASTARVSKVTLLTKDSFIFKIGDFHKDDLKICIGNFYLIMVLYNYIIIRIINQLTER